MRDLARRPLWSYLAPRPLRFYLSLRRLGLTRLEAIRLARAWRAAAREKSRHG